MEILQMVLLAISSMVTLYFLVSTFKIWVTSKEIEKTFAKEVPDLNNKIAGLFTDEYEDAFKRFKKYEMAATILFMSMKTKFLSSVLNATIASAITTYIYFM